MDWVVIFLIVIVFMLWWIRWALEPIRQFFQNRQDEKEEAAAERLFAVDENDPDGMSAADASWNGPGPAKQ